MALACNPGEAAVFLHRALANGLPGSGATFGGALRSRNPAYPTWRYGSFYIPVCV